MHNYPSPSSAALYMMKDKGLHASMPFPQTGYPRYPHAIIIIIVISIYFKKDNIIILECGKKTLILSSTGSLPESSGLYGLSGSSGSSGLSGLSGLSGSSGPSGPSGSSGPSGPSGPNHKKTSHTEKNHGKEILWRADADDATVLPVQGREPQLSHPLQVWRLLLDIRRRR